MGLALLGGQCLVGHGGARVAGEKGQRGAVRHMGPRRVILWWAGGLKISPSPPPSLCLVKAS